MLIELCFYLQQLLQAFRYSLAAFLEFKGPGMHICLERETFSLPASPAYSVFISQLFFASDFCRYM